MAKSKDQLIAEGKEIGLNLNKKMSVYELTHRINDKRAELAQKQENPDAKKSTKSARGGEY